MDRSRIPQTLAFEAARWLAQRRAGVRAQSVGNYRRTLAGYVAPTALWTMRLDRIDGAAVRACFTAMLDRGLSANTCRLAGIALSGVFRSAIEEGRIQTNPVPDAVRSILGRAKRDAGPADAGLVIRRADQIAFAAALHRVSPTVAYPAYFLILARTGIRPGEAAALRVDDFDFDTRRVRIERTWTDGLLGPTKSGKVRYVDVSLELARITRAYIASGAPRGGWLFPGRDGDKPLWSANFQKVMKQALRAAGLPQRLHPHSFRHAWATVLLEEGLADLFYVQRQLGHSSIRTTCDLYARAAEPRNLAAVDALDRPPLPPDGRRPPLRLVPSKHRSSETA